MIVVDGKQHEVGADDDFADIFNDLRVVKRKSKLVQIYGEHEVTKPLNCSHKRHRTVFDWSGARLTAKSGEGFFAGRYAVIDMTHSTGVTHTGLHLTVESGSAAFGILQSRDRLREVIDEKTGEVNTEGNDASGKNRFYDCNVGGHMDVGFYNIGAEVSEVYGLNISMQNPTATAAVYMAVTNVLGAQSPFGYEPENSSSATGALFNGLHVRCDSEGNSTPGLVIDGFDEIKIYGAYMRTKGTAPYIVVDSTNNSIDGVLVHGFSSHGNPPNGMEIMGNFNNGIVNLRVVVQQLNGDVPISIGPVDLISAYFDHSQLVGISVAEGARLRNVKENGRESLRDLDQTPQI